MPAIQSWVFDTHPEEECQRGEILMKKCLDIDHNGTNAQQQLNAGALIFAAVATKNPSIYKSLKHLNDALEEALFDMKDAKVFLIGTIQDHFRNLHHVGRLRPDQEASIRYEHNRQEFTMRVRVANMPLGLKDRDELVELHEDENSNRKSAERFAAIEVAYRVYQWRPEE